MNKENEKNFMDNFISGLFNRKIFCCTKSNFCYEKYLASFFEIRQFEHPDFYSFDGKTVYIYEHFEVDASKTSRKGSQSRIDLYNDDKRFEAKVSKNPILVKSNQKNDDLKPENLFNNFQSIYHSQINTELTPNYFLDNICNSFDKHYKEIEKYKIAVCKELNIDKNKYDFCVTFMIEDKTTFGTMYYDNCELKTANPLYSNEFLDHIADKKEVDLITYSTFSTNNSLETFLYSTKNEAIHRSCAVNLLEKHIINLLPNTIGMELEIKEGEN